MIRKIQLISNNICYGPMPKADQEVEQHLTILSDGRVWLSKYCYGDGDPYRLISMETKRIEKEFAGKILMTISHCFTEKSMFDMITDNGSWKLKTTSENDTVMIFEGSLYYDERIEIMHISEMIRDAMKDPSLFAFDGAETEDDID